MGLFQNKKEFFEKIKYSPFLMQYPSPEVWKKNYDKDMFLDKVLDLNISILNLYFHIPFCDYLCSYCSFSKILKNDKYIDEYLNKLDKEIEFWSKIIDFSKIKIETIFVGGGTPTILDKKYIKKFGQILVKYGIKTNGEFTIETNPDRINENFLYWKEIGVNRVSIGQQTFDENILKSYNRNSISFDNFIKKIEFLRKIGFSNINIDMIYGLKQQKQVLQNDIEKLLNIAPEHISLYPLILYNKKLIGKDIGDFFQELENDYIYITQKLENYSFYTMEYAVKKDLGNNYVHNYQVNYLKGKNVLGFGPSGFSFLENIWFKNYFSIFSYLENKFSIEYVYFLENKKIDLQRKFILGIRLNRIFKNIVDDLEIDDFYFYKFFQLIGDSFILRKNYRKYQNLLLYYFNQKFNGLAYN